MRIAILDRDRCQQTKCAHECHDFCPPVRMGEECIVFPEDGKPVISEVLCIGCNICVQKCPFDAITIVNFAEELKETATHRYGVNLFALYGLPLPATGRVTALLGPNGTGKSTTLRVLSGELLPNLGQTEITREDLNAAPRAALANWEEVLRHFAGTGAHAYFKRLQEGGFRVSVKPQTLDPGVLQGAEVDPAMARRLEVDPARPAEDLSGGELQRLAIAACLSRPADLYFLDEVTPFLDIFQRIRVARLLREFAEQGHTLLLVDHDLAILDLVADTIHVIYGTPGAYGVATQPRSPRVAINEYLQGYLPEENVRIRPEAITFEPRAPPGTRPAPTLATFGPFTKTYPASSANAAPSGGAAFKDGFTLEAGKGEIREAEVLGVVGPNAIGKSTFARILANTLEPDAASAGGGSLSAQQKGDSGTGSTGLRIAYKPQYIRADLEMTVSEFLAGLTPAFGSSAYETDIIRPLHLDRLLLQPVRSLSGGELQRTAIAACLSREADLYILDEPSAHLDVEQRAQAIKTIRQFAKNRNKSALVVDHDIYLIDLLSDRLLVFTGEPGRSGKAEGPFEMREGMNRFLQDLNITFRRDETGRPRINKPDSRKDREQRSSGEYYYLAA